MLTRRQKKPYLFQFRVFFYHWAPGPQCKCGCAHFIFKIIFIVGEVEDLTSANEGRVGGVDTEPIHLLYKLFFITHCCIVFCFCIFEFADKNAIKDKQLADQRVIQLLYMYKFQCLQNKTMCTHVNDIILIGKQEMTIGTKLKAEICSS